MKGALPEQKKKKKKKKRRENEHTNRNYNRNTAVLTEVNKLNPTQRQTTALHVWRQRLSESAAPPRNGYLVYLCVSEQQMLRRDCADRNNEELVETARTPKANLTQNQRFRRDRADAQSRTNLFHSYRQTQPIPHSSAKRS